MERGGACTGGSHHGRALSSVRNYDREIGRSGRDPALGTSGGGHARIAATWPRLAVCVPRPVDRVVRVQVKHVWEVPITTLIAEADDEDEDRQIPEEPSTP